MATGPGSLAAAEVVGGTTTARGRVGVGATVSVDSKSDKSNFLFFGSRLNDSLALLHSLEDS